MVALLVVIAACLLTAGAAQPPETELVRNRLDAYLAAYEPELSALVAREVMTQSVVRNPEQRDLGTRRAPPAMIHRVARRLESEVAFVPLPGDAGWLGARLVRKVDGKSVETPDTSLGALLRSTAPVEAARQLLDAGARYNLGLRRNTNLPNLPLELLHPRHRHRFSHALRGRKRIDGEMVSVLGILETVRPTLVRGVNGEPMLSDITAWVDDAGGVRRAEVTLRSAERPNAPTTQVISVVFGRHAALGLLVPLEMREEFVTDDPRAPRGTGVAKYSEFRRFETSARIVP